MQLVEEFCTFIQSAPSSYHAAEAAAGIATAAGFSRVGFADPHADLASPGGHVCVLEGAAIAWWVPESPFTAARLVGAHTDSPGFKLKPTPQSNASGFARACVEVYGGAILSSWFDRELVLAGQVHTRDGARLITTDPIFRISHLAIHLDRSVNESFAPNRQVEVQPMFGMDGDDLLEIIATAAGISASDLLTWDLITCAAQPPALTGAQGSWLASCRLDNLSSVFPAFTALTRAEKSDTLLIAVAFDHEEVGSASATGAGGRILESLLTRICGGDRVQLENLLANSVMVSADAAHSIHPNYATRHDPDTYPVLGGGPVVKFNANQRYATTPHTAAIFTEAARRAGVAVQQFVSNNTVPCGSTIGPALSTRMGIPTVDVGVPLLSMHSARELADIGDIADLTATLVAFYE